MNAKLLWSKLTKCCDEPLYHYYKVLLKMKVLLLISCDRNMHSKPSITLYTIYIKIVIVKEMFHFLVVFTFALSQLKRYCCYEHRENLSN